MKNATAKTQKGLSNHEIVTLAVYLLGGDAGRVDTEDVAVKANELADTVTIQEAEEFFRIDAYVTGNSREQKVTRALNAFGSDHELRKAIKLLAERVKAGGKQ